MRFFADHKIRGLLYPSKTCGRGIFLRADLWKRPCCKLDDASPCGNGLCPENDLCEAIYFVRAVQCTGTGVGSFCRCGCCAGCEYVIALWGEHQRRIGNMMGVEGQIHTGLEFR